LDMSGMFYNATSFNQNLAGWSLNPIVSMSDMFYNSGMDCIYYSSTLTGWSNNPNTPNNRTLGANGMQYGTNAVTARNNLISNKGWTINGDSPSGDDCSLPLYVLTLSVNPSQAGTTTGAGQYTEGVNVPITATANEGWQFVNWTDEATNVVSNQASFTFTMPAANTTLTANFEEIPVVLPTLTTTTATNITSSTATSGGNITSDGGAAITARGVVWSTTQNPAIDNNEGITNDGTGAGIYTSDLTGLSPATTYYVRAYATNSAGTAYGEQLQFTTLAEFKILDISILLEGAFNGTNGMHLSLNTAALIPGSQPYNTTPWNYTGLEEASSIPADVVDWLLVELRDATSPENASAATTLTGWPKALFLKNDGSLLGLDGNAPNIGNPVVNNNLYIVIRHRNHLDVLSNGPLVLAGNTYTYDFTDAITKAFGGALGYKQIASGVFGMVAGDSDADGEVSVLDFSTWASQFGGTGVYSKADNDMDGEVSVLDFSKWAINFGTGNPVSSAEEQIKYRSQVPE